MKNVRKLTVAAVAALIVPALLGAVPVYGRAGGVVGAASIERIASYVSPQDLKDFDSGSSRAGGALGKAPAPTQEPGGSKIDVAAA